MIKIQTLGFLTVACLFPACDKGEIVADPSAPEPEPAHPWDLVPTDPDLLAGREIYLVECALCHNEGEEHAPPLTDHEDWATREAKGLEVLFDHAINGFVGDEGEMPARGGTDTLTDTEVQNAIRFMLATQNPS